MDDMLCPSHVTSPPRWRAGSCWRLLPHDLPHAVDLLPELLLPQRRLPVLHYHVRRESLFGTSIDPCVRRDRQWPQGWAANNRPTSVFLSGAGHHGGSCSRILPERPPQKLSNTHTIPAPMGSEWPSGELSCVSRAGCRADRHSPLCAGGVLSMRVQDCVIASTPLKMRGQSQSRDCCPERQSYSRRGYLHQVSPGLPLASRNRRQRGSDKITSALIPVRSMRPAPRPRSG
jgi:hypothetical protein